MLSNIVSNAFNESAISCKLLSVLKLADVTSVQKKSRLEKYNYQPGSFERCIYKQISEYFGTVFSKFQWGFQKGYSTQDCLLTMVENYKKALDQGNEYGSLLTDLSKVFDCLQHDVIVAKLHVYSFSIESLKLINSYLTERTQRVKGNDQFSPWLDIVVGVPQGLYWVEICFFFVMT